MSEVQVVESATAAETRIVGFNGVADEQRKRQLVRFIKTGSHLWLPVNVESQDVKDRHFGVILTNENPNFMVGFPAYLGRGGLRLCCVFNEQQEMNPNKLRANGGFMEAGQWGSRGEKGIYYDTTEIDSIRLSDGEQKFVARAGGDFGEFGEPDEEDGEESEESAERVKANQLLIYRRTSDATIEDVLGVPPGTRSTRPSGPRIGLAEKTADGRQLTGLGYKEDADPEHPIFTVNIVTYEQANAILDESRVEIPPNWQYGEW